jgi:shikimate kinase
VRDNFFKIKVIREFILKNHKEKSANIIAIIGLMGVGKTTLGLKLADKLGYYFIDSDQEIEDREKRSINDIFDKNGEKYFREIEKKVIQEVILRDEKIVLSLGGGAFINEEVRKILKEKAIVIWLHASIDNILHRIGYKNNRPLLNKVNKRKTLEDLVKKRYSIYAESDFNFDTGEENQESVINKIVKQVNEHDK